MRRPIKLVRLILEVITSLGYHHGNRFTFALKYDCNDSQSVGERDMRGGMQGGRDEG